MSSPADEQPVIDYTSTDMTNRDELEKEIASRPNAEDLTRRGILKSGGTLAAQRSRLERELAKDAISRQISERPEMENLVQANIIQEANLAPSLQSTARRLERNIKADRLNQHLYARQEHDQLPEQVFPAENIAPRLRQAKIALEHAFTRDHLNHLLAERPSADKLVQKNILQAKPTVAPSLQAAQRELQKQMTSDRINQMLDNRSNAQRLERENILQDTRVSSSLQSAQHDLARNLARSNLYHALQSRPGRRELEERGILCREEDVEYYENLQPRQFAENDSSKHRQHEQTQNPQDHENPESSPYRRRSRNFVLTRLLLKFVANLGEAGEISMQQKGFLKDMIVDQDPAILAAAEVFECDGQIDEFKDTLLRLTLRNN